MEKKKSAVSLPLLTVSETAKFLGIGRKMVYQLIDLGEIKAVKVGRSIAIEEKVLDQYRASG